MCRDYMEKTTKLYKNIGNGWEYKNSKLSPLKLMYGFNKNPRECLHMMMKWF